MQLSPTRKVKAEVKKPYENLLAKRPASDLILSDNKLIIFQLGDFYKYHLYLGKEFAKTFYYTRCFFRKLTIRNTSINRFCE